MWEVVKHIFMQILTLNFRLSSKTLCNPSYIQTMSN